MTVFDSSTLKKQLLMFYCQNLAEIVLAILDMIMPEMDSAEAYEPTDFGFIFRKLVLAPFERVT